MLQRLLVLFLPLVLAACSGLPLNAVAPRVSVGEVGLRHFDWFEQHYEVGLQLSNPNEFDLEIEALDFEIELNGLPFASGQSRNATVIPALSGTVLRVDAITQSKNLVQQIRALQPEATRDGVSYRVRGRVKTGHSPIWLPFDHAGLVGGEKQKIPRHPG
jgi:LEA14-like dessication related protein